ncbi:S-methyl-5'-thioadenosine phosphorylase [Jannaschia aquimarina]|uniref:S-methyl-5'-thioadenosine phosphorylase n=1 Tax=Jannaschia aquimarina TaxID=935700 RepID=A0A0D1EBJ4_9RHOB|nr:S-methyl-5'-thioadenosine phosphorylase [Jannaschia aquimarina]KIT14261.1 S-methyl-5'-thioadenosine phosphorylase [Jannaschia aquimarina]SNS49466.1 5'-methylthioadenosine phosphorylase [Jannaschia aquimarina]
MDPVLGIIGGSGLYGIEGLDGAWRAVDTPWGAPSDEILDGTLGGLRVLFLPRHGRGHVHDPATIPYLANIAALKSLGATHVVSVSAVGSFREEMAPGHFVVVDQFVDRTRGRPASFFGTGCVAHVSLAHPICDTLATACAAAAREAGATVHEGGIYLAMEGPQFSSLAESALYRAWGCDVIGMTNMPEARLAREAELHYATIAMVTDYDSWHPDHGAVEIAEIIATLKANAHLARATVAALPAHLDASCGTGCATALDHAIMTAPEARDPALIERLRVVAGRVV